MRFLTSFGMKKKVINKFKKEIKRKKILFAIAIVLTIGLAANAQDGFFRNWDNGDGNRENMTDPNSSIHFPYQKIDETGNDQAPLGSGLLILTALGAGYAVARRNRKK